LNQIFALNQKLCFYDGTAVKSSMKSRDDFKRCKRAFGSVFRARECFMVFLSFLGENNCGRSVKVVSPDAFFYEGI
jgi:hypothetical protein